MSASRALLLGILLAGCAAPGPEPSAGAPAAEPRSEIALTAHAVVPDPFDVSRFPAAAPGAPGDPGSARMDAPFVRCERADDAPGFGYFGAGVVVEPPAGHEGTADLHYFGFGLIIEGADAAGTLAAWGIAPIEEGPVTHETGGAPLRETRSEAASGLGVARLDDRLLPAEPVARPSEIYRVHFAPGLAFDLLIEPHDAIVGEGTFRVEGATGWLATLPPSDTVSTSAYAAAPTWDVVLKRVDA